MDNIYETNSQHQPKNQANHKHIDCCENTITVQKYTHLVCGTQQKTTLILYWAVLLLVLFANLVKYVYSFHYKIQPCQKVGNDSKELKVAVVLIHNGFDNLVSEHGNRANPYNIKPENSIHNNTLLVGEVCTVIFSGV